MPLSDEEADALKAERDSLKQQMTALLEEKKLTEGDRTKEKERAASPGKVKLDPDIVKEMAELKKRLAEIEGKLGKGSAGGGFQLMNLFGEK